MSTVKLVPIFDVTENRDTRTPMAPQNFCGVFLYCKKRMRIFSLGIGVIINEFDVYRVNTIEDLEILLCE